MDDFIFYIPQNDHLAEIPVGDCRYDKKVLYDFITSAEHGTRLRKMGVRVCPFMEAPRLLRTARRDGYEPLNRIISDFNKIQKDATDDPISYLKNNSKCAFSFLEKALWEFRNIVEARRYEYEPWIFFEDQPDYDRCQEHTEAENALKMAEKDCRRVELYIRLLERNPDYEKEPPARFWEYLEVKVPPPMNTIAPSGEECLVCREDEPVNEEEVSQPVPDVLMAESEEVLEQRARMADAMDFEVATAPPTKKRKPRKKQPFQAPHIADILKAIQKHTPTKCPYKWTSTAELAKKISRTAGHLKNIRGKLEERDKVAWEYGTLSVDQQGRVFFISEEGDAFYYADTGVIRNKHFNEFYRKIKKDQKQT